MAVIEIVTESPEWESFEDLPARLETAIAAAIAATQVTTLPQAEIAVLLTDDEGIAILNERWRGKASATNVLSWPATSPKLLPLAPMIGDIAIAFETAAREAEEEGKPFEHHLAHLAVHGALHLLGFDHATAAEADEMESLERDILRGLQIADPYLPQPNRKGCEA